MEEKLLMELQESLRADIEFCKSGLDGQKANIDHIEELIKYLEANLPYSDTLGFGKASYYEQFQVIKSDSETLKHMGLEKLASQVIKRQPTSYYEIDVPER